MSEELLWKDCAEWLVQCTILPPDHRVTWPNAQPIDLARTLQDGSVLCQLLHALRPGCLDLKDANLRPQLSEFLCLRNITLFLDTCQKHFGMRPNQIFEPSMLFELVNFGEVLRCLSELSKSQPVRARGFPFFPKIAPANTVEYYNVDAFKNLEDLATSNEDDDTDNFSPIEATKEEEHIYEDLCYIKIPGKELSEPKDKREYCLRELLDTENNYVEALHMIINKFLKPIRPVISSDDLLSIFVNIEELANFHRDFYADLRRACQSLQGTGKHLNDCFIKWRMKFAIYGRYCASLQKAQQCLDDLCAKSETISGTIKKCQNETNDGKFRLRDLLSLPMQRILKYHLLLRELKKHSLTMSQEDQTNLQSAHDLMVDIALYINEVKRDSEMIELIKTIEDSISDLTMPESTHLTTYGRLLIDGQVRFRPHEATTPKTRHIFVFDRVMLIVKTTKADQYSFKDALIMSDFRVDETLSLKPVKDKWNHPWHVYNFKDRRIAYTMAVKTEDLRKRWIEAIKLALENLNPPCLSWCQAHRFEYTSFDQPTLCSVCDKLLRGSFFQGYRCTTCGGVVHKECIPSLKACGTPAVPARSRSSLSGRSEHRHSSGGIASSPAVKCPRAMSFGHFSSMEGKDNASFTGGMVKSGSVDNGLPAHHEEQENSNGLLLPTGANRNSLMSPTSPGSPFNPFSPATNGQFVYKDEEDEHLVIYPWFAGHMDREKAEEILQRFPNGTFLLRISSKGDSYKAISIKYEDKVRHIKILISPDSQSCYLAPNKYFRKVWELIGYYEETSLADSFQGMRTTLRIPYKRALLPQDSRVVDSATQSVYPRAVVRYSFSATSSNMLTIKVGDTVEILSKNGEQRGWWKGRCSGKVGYFPLSYVEEIRANETTL